jgi:hypothetical protein
MFATMQPGHYDAGASVQRLRFFPFHDPHEDCPCSYLASISQSCNPLWSFTKSQLTVVFLVYYSICRV